MITPMTSMERTLAALSQREPDRVPLFLLTTLHGARELGLTIREYFSRSRFVVDGQLRLLRKYGGDCLYPFFYAPIEIEAWGGEVIFVTDGPPNSGEPFINNAGDINRLEVPRVADTPCLGRVLDTIGALKTQVGGNVPIIGVVMSPFSIPAMQMGFERYIELIYAQPILFERLMRINEEFAVQWANAQLAAGATAICYFDPLSSPTNIPPELYRRTGQVVARRTLARINGPTATHMASGLTLPILPDIIETGTAVVGVSALEDLAPLKAAAGGRISLMGNLNGIEMRRWTADQAEAAVKKAIAAAGRGGGFLLSDNHGEIPWQVADEVLLAIGEAARHWGRYPLTWVDGGD